MYHKNKEIYTYIIIILYMNKYENKELNILRKAVDKAELSQKRELVNSPLVSQLIHVVENFIKSNGNICYGGTAINNILPKKQQFYDRSVELPDYDVYSINAIKDAKQISDIFAKKGFSSIEAKSGIHHGTYKVYVNFIPVMDITQLDKELFNSLSKHALKIRNILYAPPDFLRMSMYLELSRPKGDVSRWEKVQKRLVLLNKTYPIGKHICKYKNFQRTNENPSKTKGVYDLVRNTFIKEGVIFFGGYASNLFSDYMKIKNKYGYPIPDFDVLAVEPEKVADNILKVLEKAGFENVSIYIHPKVGEIISTHYEIKVGVDTISFIYEPLACHSYNTIKKNDKQIKVASIDTMLSFYLAFMYIDRPYYNFDRLVCMAKFLYDVQIYNRFKQEGLLKRFSTNCYGKQETLTSIREKKAKKFLTLKKGTKEYNKWFFKYIPKTKKQLKTKFSKKNKKTINNKKRKNKYY